jgi:hypothetical protein
LRKFFPVPPNTSLPSTTPKLIPRATCHNGTDGGRVRANSTEVTKKPSLTSWRRMLANSTSQKPPTMKVVRYTGRKYAAPWTRQSHKLFGSNPASAPIRAKRQPSWALNRPGLWAKIRLAWWPTLYMPKNIAGKVHSQTMIIMRFRSMPSRTCAVVRVTLPGR